MAYDTIEIYVHDLSEAEAVTWLREVFEELEQVRDAPIVTYEGVYDGANVPVQITEEVQGGSYTSVWFNAPTVPWSSTEECAKAAHAALEKEVLCYPDRSDEPWTVLRMINGEKEYVDERELSL